MWETWLYKTLMAFISIQILEVVFRSQIKKVFRKNNTNGVGFVKGTVNCLLISMIPVMRWVFVSLVVIAIFAGTFIDEEK